MKKVYIIHRWGADSTSDWIPWLKEELEKKDIRTVSDMQDTNNPTIENWIDEISGIVTSPDSDTYFVGHSIGCQAVVRYLSTLPEGVSIGGSILVESAPHLCII